jgi:hypothetical protein
MGEFTYTAKRAKGKAFIHTELTRSDVHISKGLDYLTLSLKRSKMDRENQGVNIIVAATGDAACPVTLLRHLYNKALQPRDAPLFRFNTRTFHRATVVKALHARLECLSINTKGFSGHSFRKGATQHAHDSGLLNEQIETLGRWSSDAFQLYSKASHVVCSSSIANSNQDAPYEYHRLFLQ